MSDIGRVWQIAFDALNVRRELYYRVSEFALNDERSKALDMIRAAMIASGITEVHVPSRLFVEDHGLVMIRPDGDGGVFITVEAT